MVFEASSIYHENLSSNLRLLQSREVINGKEWTTSIEKAEKLLEIIISCLDSIHFDLASLKEPPSESSKDPFGGVLWFRAFKKAYGSFTSEEEAWFQKNLDNINLESIETPLFASIKPCSYFTKDKLYDALVTRGLRPHERPRQKRPCESL